MFALRSKKHLFVGESYKWFYGQRLYGQNLQKKVGFGFLRSWLKEKELVQEGFRFRGFQSAVGRAQHLPPLLTPEVLH